MYTEKFETLKDRLTYILEQESLAVLTFSQKIGKSRTTIVKIMNGVTTKLHQDTARAIEQTFGYNYAWIMEGKGEIKNPNKIVHNSNSVHKQAKQIEVAPTDSISSIEHLKQMLELAKQEMATKDRIIEGLLNLANRSSLAKYKGVSERSFFLPGRINPEMISRPVALA